MNDKINAIKKNISLMISQGATQPEIDLYVSSFGMTPNDLREIARKQIHA